MTIGVLGRKIGMTRIFTEEGVAIPVTVIEIQTNRVSQIKTLEADGYTAIQVTSGIKKTNKVNKPSAGHFIKANIPPGDMLMEFKTNDVENYNLGQEIEISSLFLQGQLVDVSAFTKGKGYAGTVKRHNFRTQDASHGNSVSHRAPGSIGQNQTPGKVFKGKKMAGRLGNTRCTTQNLELIRVDAERKLLLIKGAVPGVTGARVEIKHAVKIKQRGVA